MTRSFLVTVLAAGVLASASARAQAQEQTRSAADSARAADSLARGTRARELARVRVVAERDRKAAYAATASRTAMKTNTPLRDTPQSATVLTRSVIAD